jgi:hypothetical protein
MLYFFRLFLLLIKMDDQKTVVNWFDLDSQVRENTANILVNQTEAFIPIEMVKIILKESWQRVQDGLTLADIENLLFFILFIRFIILAIRYNLKTSFILHVLDYLLVIYGIGI